MRIVALVRVALDVPDADDARAAATAELARRGWSGGWVVAAERADLRWVRTSGMCRGRVAHVHAWSGGQVTYSYEGSHGRYRVPASWFLGSMCRESPADAADRAASH